MIWEKHSQWPLHFTIPMLVAIQQQTTDQIQQFLISVSHTLDINTHQHVLSIKTYRSIQHDQTNMRNLLSLSILSMLPITNAKYIPIRVRQVAPTSTPAVLVLEQNPGCCLLSSASQSALHSRQGLQLLHLRSKCLVFAIRVLFGHLISLMVLLRLVRALLLPRYVSLQGLARKHLAEFSRNILAESKTSQLPSVYIPILNLGNFCSNVGNIFGPASASATTTSTPQTQHAISSTPSSKSAPPKLQASQQCLQQIKLHASAT